MSLFDKILIANRGEIACRVMRTCRQLGIATVAVYSEADRNAEHVRIADESVCIGPPEATASYLDRQAVLEAALTTGSQAIHPGYGFLSENAEFAEMVEAAGLMFIGPKAASMRAMGSKAGAKALMAAHGVPVVPGYGGEDQDPAHLQREADAVGYPLMIKAAHGGGGKGMRIVHEPAVFAAALESCQREARNAFGKDRVLLERYIEKPRHIEFQIFADSHGNTIHLGERECSAQRRFQKVIEESPSPFLDAEHRARMAQAAVAAARAVDYRNAGTVEFIVAPNGDFYFMEINSRLQVEHPVTEMVTGLDLVQWQIEVAAGRPLPLPQDAIRHQGHAIEVRLYAENPDLNFMPGSGTIRQLHLPDTDPGLRIDGGFRQGDHVSVFYDPMLAKLIVHADSREAALQRLQDALAGCQIFGLPSNIGFLEDLVAHPAVQRGDIDTGFLDRNLNEVLKQPEQLPAWHTIAAAYFSLKAAEHAVSSAHSGDPWSQRDFWRPYGQAMFRVAMKHHADYEIFQIRLAGDQLSLSVHDAVFEARIRDAGRDMVSLDLDGRHHTLHCFHYDNALVVHDGRRRSHWQIRIPGSDAGDGANRSDGFIRAPMPGKLAVLKVQSGQSVQAGDELAIMESMKMELSIKAPGNGSITGILAEAGSMLDSDAGIFSWEPAND
ncbi:MAG: acetyl-CoA carboxylase biotin carboxylase subunit [Xanthomonadaceae bacterium]|nr:acetyl-CoA carboxylase biotin carboxylase subunit [Xanthomonadaceae bacterium]